MILMLPNLFNFNKCLSPETRYFTLDFLAKSKNLSSDGSALTILVWFCGILKTLPLFLKTFKICLTVSSDSSSLELNFGRSKTSSSSSRVSFEKQQIISPSSISGAREWAFPGHRKAESKTFVSRTININYEEFLEDRTALISSSSSFGEIFSPTFCNFLAIWESVRFGRSLAWLFTKVLISLSSFSRFSNFVNIWPFISRSLYQKLKHSTSSKFVYLCARLAAKRAGEGFIPFAVGTVFTTDNAAIWN